MIGKVTVWHMTEEERLAYIEKHPIRNTTPNGSSFIDTEETFKKKMEQGRKRRWGWTGQRNE
jgi:DNA-binding IclR family transcriptional regulator